MRRPSASASSRFVGLRSSSLCAQATTGVSASVDAELLEQLVDLRVGLEVEPGEQHAVLGQEVADAEGVARVARADHAQARERARLAQQLPAGDEGLQDDVAEIRALVEHLPSERAGDGVDLAVAGRTARDDRRGAGQVRDVAGELAAARGP